MNVAHGAGELGHDEPSAIFRQSDCDVEDGFKSAPFDVFCAQEGEAARLATPHSSLVFTSLGLAKSRQGRLLHRETPREKDCETGLPAL